MLTLENILSAPIADGDAGLVLKLNGEFKVFSTTPLDGEGDMTDEQFIQTRKLQALSLVLSSPELMDQLFDVLDQMDEAGVDLIDLGKPN
jgi:hypothetical protein